MSQCMILARESLVSGHCDQYVPKASMSHCMVLARESLVSGYCDQYVPKASMCTYMLLACHITMYVYIQVTLNGI